MFNGATVGFFLSVFFFFSGLFVVCLEMVLSDSSSLVGMKVVTLA